MFKCLTKLESKNFMMKIIDQLIYVCSEKSIIIVDKTSGKIVKQKQVLKKNRRSRQFFIGGNFMYLREFCTMYKIDLDTLDIIYEWELGTDLSSDICGIGYDKVNIYAGIRNGPIAVIDKETKEVSYHPLTTSSIWTLKVKDVIYAGNVDGELLLIDKKEMEVNHLEKLHKKNLRSIYIENNLVYTASQDLSMAIFDVDTKEVQNRIKKCHRKMFYVLGVTDDSIITVSPPCHDTKIWSKKDLSLAYTINDGSWEMALDQGLIYLMNKEGIFTITL